MKNLYFRLVARMASGPNLIVLGVLWILIEFLVRPGAELEISKWSKGEGVLDLPLTIHPQVVTEQISKYGIEGKRIYSFVISTMETASAVLFFLFFSTFLYMLAKSFRNWKEAQWWKITLWGFLLDILTNCLLLHLLSVTKPGYFSSWCFVVLNGCNQIIHWLIWFLAATLLFQEAKRLTKWSFRKSDKS